MIIQLCTEDIANLSCQSLFTRLLYQRIMQLMGRKKTLSYFDLISNLCPRAYEKKELYRSLCFLESANLIKFKS